jgi:transposase-like protein
MNENEAFETFKNIRWINTNGNPVCPYCDCLIIYRYSVRKLFKCKLCKLQFKVTTNTVFAKSKLSFYNILLSIKMIKNNVNALQLSKVLNIQYKTAYSLSEKIKEEKMLKNIPEIMIESKDSYEEKRDHYSYVKAYRAANKDTIEEKRRSKRKQESEYEHFMKQMEAEE